MGKLLQFPSIAPARLGFQRVKSSYSVREISQLFGLSERRIRRWTQEGLIRTMSPSLDVARGQPPDGDEILYDFHALTQFRHVRDLRDQGLTIKQIEAELRGQLNLFQIAKGQLSELPLRLSPFEEALLLHERGESRAAECYRRAIREGDFVADAYCNLGILEYEEGKASRAFDCFTLSLRHEPRHFESHFNLGNLYFDTGNLPLSRTHYEFAVELEPRFPYPYFNLGLVHALQSNFEDARGTFLRYKELAPDEQMNIVDQLLTTLEKATSASEKSWKTKRNAEK